MGTEYSQKYDIANLKYLFTYFSQIQFFLSVNDAVPIILQRELIKTHPNGHLPLWDSFKTGFKLLNPRLCQHDLLIYKSQCLKMIEFIGSKTTISDSSSFKKKNGIDVLTQKRILVNRL